MNCPFSPSFFPHFFFGGTYFFCQCLNPTIKWREGSHYLRDSLEECYSRKKENPLTIIVLKCPHIQYMTKNSWKEPYMYVPILSAVHVFFRKNEWISFHCDHSKPSQYTCTSILMWYIINLSQLLPDSIYGSINFMTNTTLFLWSISCPVNSFLILMKNGLLFLFVCYRRRTGMLRGKRERMHPRFDVQHGL